MPATVEWPLEAHTLRRLELLATLSHASSFSVGCYREDEGRCHRSVLRALLVGHGAAVI